MCEFHGSEGNGFGDIWWIDNPIYFSSIDYDMSQLKTGGIYIMIVCFSSLAEVKHE